MALHGAATRCPHVVAALLAAGANPGACNKSGWNVLHHLGVQGGMRNLPALLEAAPHATLQRIPGGKLPLDLALQWERDDVARYLLLHGTLPLSGEVLSSIRRRRGPDVPVPADFAAVVVARQELTSAEWSTLEPVPPRRPQHSLAAALPAVLQRSEQEAALLMRCLPPEDRTRLRTLALCLARAQRQQCTPLPPVLVRRLLLTAASPPPTIVVVMGVMGCGKRCGWDQESASRPGVVAVVASPPAAHQPPRPGLCPHAQHCGQTASEPLELRVLRGRRLPPCSQY